jgi:hypothetical protein
MLMQMRAGLIAALVLFASFLGSYSCFAADKSYHRDDLADAAIRLEGQLKKEVGPVTKPPAALKREADAAFARSDPRAGLQSLQQAALAAPGDAANWLRIAKTMLQITPKDVPERTALVDRAATAAYIAYQRTAAGPQGAA